MSRLRRPTPQRGQRNAQAERQQRGKMASRFVHKVRLWTIGPIVHKCSRVLADGLSDRPSANTREHQVRMLAHCQIKQRTTWGMPSLPFRPALAHASLGTHEKNKSGAVLCHIVCLTAMFCGCWPKLRPWLANPLWVQHMGEDKTNAHRRDRDPSPPANNTCSRNKRPQLKELHLRRQRDADSVLS